MDCKKFDELLHLTYNKYLISGINAKLVFAKNMSCHSGNKNWFTIAFEIENLNNSPDITTEIWNYGGLITHKTLDHPLVGVRRINYEKLTGACKASQIIKNEIQGIDYHIDLTWPINPELTEPVYTFYDDTSSFIVGAYTCKIIKKTLEEIQK